MIRVLRRRWSWWRIDRDARRAALTPYNHAEDSERRAAIGLGILAGVLLAFVVGIILAGCGGRYPLEPGPDAGADVTPAADAGTALPACPGPIIGTDDCVHPFTPQFCCERCYFGNYSTAVKGCIDTSGGVTTQCGGCEP